MISSPHNTSSPWFPDRLLVWLLRSLAGIAGLIVVLIALFLGVEATPALRNISMARFLTDASWHPTSDQFNMTPMIVGTLLVTAGSMILATPLGLFSALFCRYHAPEPLAIAYRRLIELLAGIPSVVYGFWGLVVIVPLISHSLLAGILVLTVMILPTMALISDASLANVPREYLLGAAALGMSRWGTIRGVVLPAARCGLITAGILSLGRALGETMAVLMICGNVAEFPTSLFDPVRTLTANIALEMSYAMDIHRSSLFVSGLLLMIMIGVLIMMAEWISERELYG